MVYLTFIYSVVHNILLTNVCIRNTTSCTEYLTRIHIINLKTSILVYTLPSFFPFS